MVRQIDQFDRVFESLEFLPEADREEIEEQLSRNEEIIAALPTRQSRWWQFRPRHRTKLILTNERIIVFKRGFLRRRFEEYLLSETSNVEQRSERWRHANASEWDGEAWEANPEAARKFVEMAREQVKKVDV